MKSSRRLDFTVVSEEDIRQILQYTFDVWGEVQRARYESYLDRMFNLLLDFPDLGKNRLGGDILSYRAREHVIYYRVSAVSIQVIRVLHKKQDATEADFVVETIDN